MPKKEKNYQRETENGISEGIIWKEPFDNCLGFPSNCTLCSGGYFRGNNTCVKNCSEGNDKDYLLRVCYSKTLVNKTLLIERDVYVNVSFSDPNNLIEKIICMISKLKIFIIIIQDGHIRNQLNRLLIIIIIILDYIDINMN